MPIIAHPALTGSFFHHPYSGISPDVLLGTIMRIAGADIVIYPNFGGRFPFTQEICQKINRALKQEMDILKPSLPMPGGGIMDISALRRFYGNDVVFLIGSNLYNYSDNLTASVQYFLSLMEP